MAGPPLGGYRFRIEARLDGRVFVRFPLDLGQGDVTTTQPELIPGQVDLDFAGIPTPTLAVYPLPDHFAEKLHAYTRPRENPSRVKDLVDMLLLIDMGLQATPLLRAAIDATFLRYDTHSLPLILPAPPASWELHFAALAEEVGLATSSTTEAHQRLVRFLEAILSST